jgi:hypothetical protein
MATKYFYNTASEDWNNIANWWNGSGESGGQASSIPDATDDVIIEAAVSQNEGPPAICNTLLAIDASTSIDITVLSGAIYGGYGGLGGGTITGDVTFNDNSQLSGHIIGNCVLNDNSYATAYSGPTIIGLLEMSPPAAYETLSGVFFGTPPASDITVRTVGINGSSILGVP